MIFLAVAREEKKSSASTSLKPKYFFGRQFSIFEWTIQLIMNRLHFVDQFIQLIRVLLGGNFILAGNSTMQRHRHVLVKCSVGAILRFL